MTGLPAATDAWADDAPRRVLPDVPSPLVRRGVSYDHAEKLTARAKEAGIECVLHALEGKGHAAWTSTEHFIRWIPPFLDRHVIRKP